MKVVKSRQKLTTCQLALMLNRHVNLPLSYVANEWTEKVCRRQERAEMLSLSWRPLCLYVFDKKKLLLIRIKYFCCFCTLQLLFVMSQCCSCVFLPYVRTTPAFFDLLIAFTHCLHPRTVLTYTYKEQCIRTRATVCISESWSMFQ